MVASFQARAALAGLFLAAVGAGAVQDRGSRSPAPAPQAPASGRGRAGADRAGAPAGGAQRDRAPALPPENPAEAYFAICDYDADGWISFKEARASLLIDRDGWTAYDADVDGRIDRGEFKLRYQAIVERGGAFPAPIPKDQGSSAPRRGPTEMLAAYDRDHDGALDGKEVARAMAEYRTTEIAPDVALEKLDRDGSRKLEPAEIVDLVAVLSPRKGGGSRAPAAKSIEDLFGRLDAREESLDRTPLPARVAGPVPPFLRLDPDRDGKISLQDLARLQRPLQLSVRLPVLLSALDADGDGGISEVELRESMRPSRP